MVEAGLLEFVSGLENCNVEAKFVSGLEGCNAEAMLAKMAAQAGMLQVEITGTIVARNCCPKVDYLLLGQDAADEERMLLIKSTSSNKAFFTPMD